MRSKLSLIILAILIFSQCNQKDEERDETNITISLLDKSHETIDLVLSDFVSEIEYIPLETREECLIDQGAMILDCDDFFLVGEAHQDLMMFDKSGKFLGEFAQNGLGPGEYRIFVDLYYDKKNQMIILADSMSKKLWFYRKNGEFVKGVDMAVGFSNMYRLPNGTFLGVSLFAVPSDSGSFTHYLIDTTGFFSPLDLHEADDQDREVIMSPSIVGIGDRTFFLPGFSYTMKVIEENEVTQKVFFDPEEAALPPNLLSNAGDFSKNNRDYICFLSVYPGFDQKIFISYFYKKKPFLGLLNMNDYTLQMINPSDGEDNTITNDIDGGPNFLLEAIRNQNSWSRLMWIHDLQEQSDENHPLIKGLNPEDNPVLVVYKKRHNEK